MTTLYVMDIEGNHVATINGKDNAACEAAYMKHYDINDYVFTYSPAFGFGGAVENDDAEVIEA